MAAADGDRRLLSDLVVAGREGTPAVHAVLEAAMATAGCTTRFLDYDPATVSLTDEFADGSVSAGTTERCLIGRLDGSGDGRSLILFAHPDTEEGGAGAGWSSDPFTPVVRDGRMIGWGVADDLAGLVMLVRAIARLHGERLRPRGDVVLVSAPSKTHRRGIAAALHDGVDADAAVYLHPAESGRGLDEIKAFAPGQLEFRITIAGEAPDTAEPAHTAFSHRAVNPFDKARIVAAALDRFGEARGRAVHHPRLDQAIGRSANLMLTECAFGDGNLTRIAETCRLAGAMTLVPGEQLEVVQADVESAIAAVSRHDPWLAAHPPEIAWLSGVSAAETPDDAPIYRTVAAVLARHGATPQVNPLHTSSDIRNPIVQKEIPTVGFGPLCGDLAMAGGIGEWVDLADLSCAVAATADIICDWCGVVEDADGRRQ
ncbi:M20/M25/M40 family metallo-hydrolase [Bauldia sp.]|uniref:M20/M25/M40 family metallo-hydrolase n=1 Tax=Bauldia sp. TaxID=2575872 RepID=UPI003BAA274C